MIKRRELSETGSCFNKARDDEILFVLLARDAAAPATVRAWCAERVRLGKNAWDDPQVKEALKCAEAMEQQRDANPCKGLTAPETCHRCDGDGKAHGADRPFEWSGPGTYPGPCPVCGGTGKEPDNADR